jgi:uncharacterized YigZ family protein
LIDSYRTVKQQVRTELKIKRSRFIATVFPCGNETEAEDTIAETAKHFHDASHNCYAWRLFTIDQPGRFRYSDAGEPSGTAGRPIYDAICGAELFNLTVVVTRYFGGIKLGTGGLSRAYRDSARSALQKAEVIEKLLSARYRISFPLNLTGLILRLLATDGVFIKDQFFTDEGEIVCDVRLSKEDWLKQQVISQTNARAEFEKV